MTRTSTTSISVASVEAIRARFPALTRRYEELPVAYFDGPGGTQVPDLVVDRMTDYLLHHNANTHWHFPTSLETDAALDGARRALADFLNASPKEIAFGNNMTTITFHVARALGPRVGQRRRDGRHRAGPPRQHRALARARARAGRHRPHRARCAPKARWTGTISSASSVRRPVWSRWARPRTRSARSATSRAPPRWCTRRAA